MTKKLERSTAFLSAFAMFMMILLYFPVGTFSNTNWAMTASAEVLTCSHADEKKYSQLDFHYHYLENEGCIYMHGYFGSNETETIPNMIAGIPVYGIESGMFSNSNSVKTVYLPDTIGEIEDGAFNESQTVWLQFPQNLTNLTSSYTEKYIERNKECTLKLTAADGYNLPSSINIYRYTTTLNAGTDYTYDSSTGDITIFADSVDIPLSITASAKKVESATISFADYYATTDPLNPVIIAKADIPENGTVSIPVSKIETDENYNYAYYWQYVEENGIIVVNEAVDIDEYEDIDDDFNCITVKEFEKTDAIAGMEYFVYVVRTGKLGSINYYVDGEYANNTLSLSPTHYNYGNNITYAAVPNKDGYDFDGWYFESDYSGEKFTEHSLEDYKDKYGQYRILKLYGRYVPETIITEATTTTISETTTTEATTTTIPETTTTEATTTTIPEKTTTEATTTTIPETTTTEATTTTISETTTTEATTTTIPETTTTETTTTTIPETTTTEATTTTKIAEETVKLKAPTNVEVDNDGNVTWDTAEGAVSYKVSKVVNGITKTGAAVKTNNYTFAYFAKGQAHEVYVTAFDANGNSVKSEKVTITPLAAPANVKVVDGVVTWDAVDGAKTYRVTKTVNGITKGANTADTKYIFQNLAEGVEHIIAVTAYSADGNAVKSEEVKYTPAKKVILKAPTNVEVDNDGNVTWDTAEGAVSYEVSKVVNGVTKTGAAVKTNNYTFAYFAKGQTHDVYVTAFDANGNSVKSEKVTITPLAAPANVKVVDGVVTWDAVDGAKTYRVTKTVNGVTKGANTADTKYIFQNLAEGVEHIIAVTAYSADGNAVKSEEVKYTPAKKVTLKAPTNVEVDNDGNVTWNAAEGAVSYEVSKVVNGVTKTGAAVKTTNYKFAYFAKGQTHEVYVTAFDANGNSVKSEKVTITPLAAPANVKVVDGVVTWDAVDGAVSYKVSKVVNGVTKTGAATADTTYTFINFNPGQDKVVYVTAYDANGNSVKSDWVKVK